MAPRIRALYVVAALGLAACGNHRAATVASRSSDTSCDTPDGGADGGTHDPLSATRTLRRISLSLTGHAPLASDYQPLLDAKDDAARQQVLDAFVDQALASPTFYEIMRQFGRDWMPLQPPPSIGDAPGYFYAQQSNIGPCPAGTKYAGALTVYAANAPYQPCNGVLFDGSPAPVKQIEPWWAPGTTVTVVGYPAGDAQTSTKNGVTYDCGRTPLDPYGAGQTGCGCGPHLIYCHPSTSQGWANWQIYELTNPHGQRRLVAEEPSHLLAHIAWYDRPLTDLITGDYSVGPVELQAAYVRAGRIAGAKALDADDSWWRPEKFSGPVDPGHDATDPWAWREFKVPARDPYLLADRDYHFDPRTQPRGSMKGLPAAGVLTTIGFNVGLARERVRGARALEWFACEDFLPPPADQVFNPYQRDPATEGPCQTCHKRIDPASIYFKRWQEDKHYTLPTFALLGIGAFDVDDKWTTGNVPPGADPLNSPWVRISRAWLPDTVLTPVTQAEADKNAQTRFIDYLPPDKTLLGQSGDGTVGPLGFAKIAVASGAFDKCVVRRLHERFGGRAINPATEAGYLQSLVDIFVQNGRKVRPFIKALMHTEVFRRGL